MIKKLFTATAFLTMLCTSPAVAQTTAASGKPSDSAEITVFARREPLQRHSLEAAQQEMAATDVHFLCAIYLKNRRDGYKHSPNTLGPLARMPAPYNVDGGFGSPSVEASSAAPPSSNPCERMASDDPRMQILIHDKNMPEAYAAYAAGDYAAALKLFIKAYNKLSIITSPQNPGEQGSAQSFRGIPALAVMVARMYLYGQGTPPDTAKAIIWFKKAANEPASPRDSTDVNAMSSQAEGAIFLARIYETGTDVAVNPKEARKWYMRAADLEYYPAMYLCGLIFRSGYGGERNMTKAMAYFTKAAEAGYAPAQYTLGQLYYDGEDGVPQDKARAGAWLLQAAQNDYPDALFAVARMYDLGEGGAKVDPEKALHYYREAAAKGQPDAQNALGLSFYAGNGVPKDLPAARQWFEKAAVQADVDAMFNLAVMLINGEGGDKDLVKAWVWLRIADAGGHPQAKAALAELEPKMTADERAKAQALFQPAAAAPAQ